MHAAHAAAGSGRHNSRDQALLIIMYRHGLRVSEAVALRWDQADLKDGWSSIFTYCTVAAAVY